LAYPGGADALTDLTAAAKRRTDDIDALDPGVRRLVKPHTYHVSITDGVFDLKRRLLDDLT
jgi:nicotinate phosphoribosyltransferase